MLELKVAVKVIFDSGLAAACNNNDVLYSGMNRLFHTGVRTGWRGFPLGTTLGAITRCVIDRTDQLRNPAL